jgi:hypothetical protein
MEYLDQTDYEQRATCVRDLMARQSNRLGALSATDKDYLDRYFIGSLTAADRTRYRKDRLKLDPNMEAQANRAYERLLAELDLPASLPAHDV